MTEEKYWGASVIESPEFLEAQRKRTNEWRERIRKAEHKAFLKRTSEVFEKAVFDSLRSGSVDEK